jgi:nucleoside-diphosphate-sugar epimerase
VKSTETVLNAAAKAGDAMESVVLVSSAAAMFDLYDDMLLQGRLYTEKDWNNYSEQVLKEKGDLAGYLHGYLESKTAGEKLFWKFRQEHKPSFAMTALQPTCVLRNPGCRVFWPFTNTRN